MSNIVALFDTVLNSYLQSFSPTVDQYFHDFDIQISSKKYSDEELDSLLENVFISFPRSDKNYANIIDKLSSFNGTNTNFIIGHICSKLSNEIGRKNDSLPTIQIYSLLTYRGTNFHHFMFIHYLILIFFSDLLLKIVTKSNSNQISSNIVKFGYGLCAQTSRLSYLHDLLIDTWSFIFYYASSNNLKCIIENFDTKFDQENPNKVIKLIHRISGNQALADSILQSFIQAKKKKILTSEFLLDLSFLLSRINCNIETLSEFYKIAWELKSVDELKFGAIMIITVLFNRIPTQTKKVLQFYQTRVYKHAQNDKKVERSLRAFLHLIRGDISKIPGPGDNSNPLVYISTTRPPSFSSQSSSSPPSSSQRLKLQNNSESYTNIFVRVFFQKSNFSICPNLFRDTLIQLASIDINEFTSLLLPKFLVLNHTDSRFIVMLKVIPFLNQNDFIKYNYSHATKIEISTINQNIQTVLFDLIPVLKNSNKDRRKTINFDSIQIQSIIDESDHVVNDFLQRNNFTLFDYNHDDRKLNKKNFLIKQNDLSIALNVLNCINVTFSNKDFIKNPELISIIIDLSCSDDQLTSEIASNICINTFNCKEIQSLFIKEATNLIFNSESFEIRSKSLQFLSYSLHNLKYDKENEDYHYEFEAASLIGLMSNSSYCRTLALNLFKQIDSLRHNSDMIFPHLIELNDLIIEKVKNFMTNLTIPEKPFKFLPLIGHITFETACYCKYNNFWIINYAEILNIIIDLKSEKVLEIINKSLLNRFNSIRKNAKQKCKKENKKDAKNKNKKCKGNGENETDFSLVSFFLCFIDSFASGKEFNGKSPESSWHIEKIDSICKKVLKCHSTRIKRSFIKSFRFLNWRVIPTVLHSTINIDTKLYSDISEALSLIIQNPTNSNKIFSQIFHVLIPYLNSFQTYFKDIQINGMSEIKWKDSLLKRLKRNEKICINYCILISVAFKKIQNDISENKWPLSYRQVHVRFLSNWAQLPFTCEGKNDTEYNFDKLKAYSVDALILILKSGTIFTNDFDLDLSILNILAQSHLTDFSVLDSLLFFHSDILLGEFIKQVLLKTQRESLIFLNSIIHVLKKLDDSADIQQWGGALVLLAIFCDEQMYDDAWRFILQKIAILLLKEKNDSDTVQMINKAENATFALTVFQFLTEQFIQFSFEVIKASQRAVVVKMIVNFLNPWIEKLRILPTQGFIIPGIPTKYRIFSVLTFFNEILSLSQNLNDEQLDVFSQIWYNLLKSSDNNVIVLLLLFEYEKNDIKQKIFEKLLDKDPTMITKFLVKRCSFAFWYSVKTQRKINLNFQSWMMKVLSRSFINYKKEATKKFVLAFHYSLLFIEKTGDLFNALIEFLDLKPVDSSFVWKSDTDIENTRGVSSIISKSINKIKKTNPKAIEKWSLEATRWAVACNDLRIAYRSLVILNCLENPLDSNFTRLLSNAVLYFLNHSYLLSQLNYNSNIQTTATEPEPEPEIDIESENDNGNENIIENVTFNLNLDENHQFNSSYSYIESFSNNDKTKNNNKINTNEEEDISSSMSIHVSSSEIDSNSQIEEISCYFSHNETISEENVIPSLDDVSFYVGECFKLLNHHFDENGIGEFAFKFVSCFIHFRPFLRNCLGNTLPIYMKFFYYSSFAENIDNHLIIDAFIPFSRSLENSRKSQEMFADLVVKAKLKALYIVASAFLQKDQKVEKENQLKIVSENQFLVPSIDIGMSYEEIIKMEFNQKEIQDALIIFTEMLKNSSKKLSNSIFIVSNDLVLKYGKIIDLTPLVPIYGSALSLIAVFESASEFIKTVSIIAPSIMSLKYNEWPLNATSIDDVKSSISEIIKDINENMRNKEEKLKKATMKERSNNHRSSSPIPNFLPSPRNNRPNSVTKNEPIKLGSTARSNISSSKIVFKPVSPFTPVTRSSSKSSFTRFSAGDAFNLLDNISSGNEDDHDDDEIIPITKCKDISHLLGLIDQKYPPKIIPFASHYEMIIGLTKEVKKKMKMKEKAEKLFSKRKYTSSLSTTSQMISNKSLGIDLAFQIKGMANLNLTKLKKIQIKNANLNLPSNNEDTRAKFITSFQEFLRLDEEISS